MSPEELFNEYQRLAPATIHRMYPDPYGICRQHRIQMSDLKQYALEGLWRGCLNYKEDKRTQIKTHLINSVRWLILERLNRETSIIKYNPKRPCEPFGLISMDVEINDDSSDHNTLHDVVASDSDVQNDVMGNLSEEHILSRLTEKQRKIVELYAKGLNGNEIGRLLNMTGENVRASIERSKTRLKGVGYQVPNRKKINRSKGRKVHIEGKVYDRIIDATTELNIKQNTICHRLKSNSDKFKEWYYISEVI